MGGTRGGDRARAIMEDGRNDVYLSAASAWEIALKAAAGRLELGMAADRWVPDRLRRHAIRELPITLAHAVQVARLPILHADPFDRLLIVQAQLERLALITADPAIERYDVDRSEERRVGKECRSRWS